MSCNWSLLLGKHDFWAKICSRAKIDRGGGGHPPPHLARLPDVALIRVNPLSPEGGWIFTPPWKNVFLKSWYLRFIKWDFKNWVNQWMATNINYILMHKSKFFETFLNNLQTVSIEYQKRLKKVGILRVKILLVFWTFDTILKEFRSFNAKNLGSLGQRAAKLPAIKVWEWFDPGTPWTWADWFECGRGCVAHFLLRPPIWQLVTLKPFNI